MADSEYREVEDSQFTNHYGGLALVRDVSNNLYYLEMQDCRGSEYFGPLKKKDIDAFYMLCSVKPRKKIK